MPELTPERLAELRALAKKATPRPWFIQRGTFRKVLREFGSTVYAADDELRYIAQCADCVNMVPTANHDNAAFIAEFANSATDLLDEIARLRAELEQARERLGMAINFLYQDAMTGFEIEMVRLPSTRWCIVGTNEVGQRFLLIGGEWKPSRGISADDASKEYPTVAYAFAVLAAWREKEEKGEEK